MKSRIFFGKQSGLGSPADFSRDIEPEVND